MFRNPRENETRPAAARLVPSVGRPPSPSSSSPRFKANTVIAPMAVKATSRSKVPPKITPIKSKSAPNGNIMAFFKKAEELADNLFVKDRFNELGGPQKKLKVEVTGDIEAETLNDTEAARQEDVDEQRVDTPASQSSDTTRVKRTGPFLDESDDEEDDSKIPLSEMPESKRHRQGDMSQEKRYGGERVSTFQPGKADAVDEDMAGETPALEAVLVNTELSPNLSKDETSDTGLGDFEGFEDVDDFDDEFNEDGEEFQERRYMAEQIKMELSDGAYGGELVEDTMMAVLSQTSTGQAVDSTPRSGDVATCPICLTELVGLTVSDASVHVNNCLDGEPSPIPKKEPDVKVEPSEPRLALSRSLFKPRAPRPCQTNPFQLSSGQSGKSSAFEKLMSGHAEDTAWKEAAAEARDSRGKQAFERTCPFYKIMPNMNIAVDAFRYGAVQGQNAYFLSHFHSDHYVGLTSSWRHGPIYCSKVTGNLVRQQLRVDPKFVVDLDFNEARQVPGTPGVMVTMIPANHCPGSSLFLFEMARGKKMTRILHCGDFRACRAHLEHPLLRPDVQDAISGKTKEQKIDMCYLDTTYLNPRYAFPSQETVIKACADMCVSLSKVAVDDTDDWEMMKRQRAGEGMVQFLANGKDNIKSEDVEPKDGCDQKKRGRLLVVVGTYSIGKERICLGIARALRSKIYASPGKQRICAALEDPELMSLITNNPREAQVHMTPLFEIRADTLDEYLRDYRDTFTRAVAFRPSGWNYKPPNSRSTESPSVQTVLYNSNWKSVYSMRELKPQPGSTKRATCYGVPYSEHSSFRELSMFVCALRIEKVIPTVNVGSAKSRERMNLWVQRWLLDRRKNGLFKAEDFES